ncbi:hypothetical protein K438DRAFT_1602209 [Mycena galopus ATCC 62051]|nr:hypothetical protein K438DRAFT_1602209 [Mycena galopus ATCC 62051]
MPTSNAARPLRTHTPHFERLPRPLRTPVGPHFECPPSRNTHCPHPRPLERAPPLDAAPTSNARAPALLLRRPPPRPSNRLTSHPPLATSPPPPHLRPPEAGACSSPSKAPPRPSNRLTSHPPLATSPPPPHLRPPESNAVPHPRGPPHPRSLRTHPYRARPSHAPSSP